MTNGRRMKTMWLVAMALPASAALVVWMPPASAAESLLARLLRIAGLTAAPSQMREPEDTAAGDVWTVTVDQGSARSLTQGGGYRSPIFAADGRLYALKDSGVVQVAQSEGATAMKVPNIVKLVGFDTERRDELVVVVEPRAGGSPLAVVSLTNRTVTPLPFDGTSQQEQLVVAETRGQERVYGDTTVFVKTESRRGLSREIRWTDVYVRRGSADAQNVSNCDGANCAEPALSPDRRTVAFVKSAR